MLVRSSTTSYTLSRCLSGILVRVHFSLARHPTALLATLVESDRDSPPRTMASHTARSLESKLKATSTGLHTPQAVHPDIAWFNQTLSSAPRNPFSWSDEPPNNRYGAQGGVASPGPGCPYPTSINISNATVVVPSAGGGPHQPTHSPPVLREQNPPNLRQTQQRQPPTNPQRRQQEEAVAPSSQSSKKRSKEPCRSPKK
ncbi:hypothetical protein D0860_00948 [Hortaea werneckii]|uniref:Uncharacterized protein n=1 Tax=Hortaea werneckii TaxID=91943 RepID=A0A3M7HTE7_HORWE|nr:hypothetical protein D0860_00948 [Hortaea werneckii]